MVVCLLQALEMLCILSSDFIVPQIECSECLYERDRSEMMVKHEGVMISLYCFAMLDPNIVHLDLRFD